MSRRPSAPPWSSRASVLAMGALYALAFWMGCGVDRSGLSSGVVRPGAGGGQMQNQSGSGGTPAGSGGSSIHFGTGGAGTGGHPVVEGSGGQTAPATGGTAGVAVATGGTGVAIATGGADSGGTGAGGRVVGSGGEGGPATPGSAARNGNGGNGGRGGAAAGASGGGNGGHGNAGGAPGSGGAVATCDPSMRENEACTAAAADCRQTCGVSALGTRSCTCANRRWSCGACIYPPGDYSCYQLPAFGAVMPCPPNTVNETTSCLATCTVCADYVDTNGLRKTGYCACTQAAGDKQRAYRCASASDWPPQ